MTHLCAVLWTTLIGCGADDAGVRHVARLKEFYNTARGLHVAYKLSGVRASKEPRQAFEKSAWQFSSGKKLATNDPHELWYDFPSMRLEFETDRWDAKQKPIGRAKNVHLLREARMYRWTAGDTWLIDNAADGLGIFARKSTELLGYNVPGSLRTTLADLCELRNRPGVESNVGSLEGGGVRIRIGPRIPKDFCGGWFGPTGEAEVTFRSTESLLPESVSYSFATGKTPVEKRKDAEAFYQGHTHQTMQLADFRPVIDQKTGATFQLPYRMEVASESVTILYAVDVLEVNPVFAADTFKPLSVTRSVKDGVAPVVKSERLQQIAKNVEAARDLLAEGVPRGEIEQFVWSKYAWSVTGVLFFCLIVVALRQRRNRAS